MNWSMNRSMNRSMKKPLPVERHQDCQVIRSQRRIHIDHTDSMRHIPSGACSIGDRRPEEKHKACPGQHCRLQHIQHYIDIGNHASHNSAAGIRNHCNGLFCHGNGRTYTSAHLIERENQQGSRPGAVSWLHSI